MQAIFVGCNLVELLHLINHALSSLSAMSRIAGPYRRGEDALEHFFSSGAMRRIAGASPAYARRSTLGATPWPNTYGDDMLLVSSTGMSRCFPK
jgi:hypothetical protein